jgi:CHAT domain-containing protein
MLRDLDRVRSGEQGKEGRYLPFARQLYSWLVEPLERDLRELGIQNLVFVMDSGLRATPLAALSAMHDGHHFIIQNYSVGLMPSVSLTDTRYRDITEVDVLAMGRDTFENNTQFDNLEAVRAEIDLITQHLWPSVNRQLEDVFNEGFTENNLIASQIHNPAGIIHLATHSTFEPGGPEESFIQFWDSQLGLDEIRRLGLDDPIVELLVLSSCRTALSSEDATVELGFAGIAVQAGVKSSLASLWDVDDFGTLGLMAEFYSQLHTAPIKAEALRRTQLAMLRGDVNITQGILQWSKGQQTLEVSPSDRVFSHPAYWSGFTIIGSPW